MKSWPQQQRMSTSLVQLMIVICSFGFATAVNADVLIKIPLDKLGSVHQITEVKGQIWLATDYGAYRIADQGAEPVLSHLLVWTVVDIRGQAWLGTEKGIFRIYGDQASPVLQEVFGSLDVTAICQFDDGVWLGTSRGLFRVDPDNPQPTVTELLRSPVNSLSVFHNVLWVATRGKAYRINPGAEPVPLLEEPIGVSSIVEAGGEVWLTTTKQHELPGPPWRLYQDSARPVFPNYQVASIAEVSGEVWLGTTDGLFRLEHDTLRVAPLPNEPVNAVADLNGELWVGTTRKIYRRSGDTFIQIPNGEARITVKGFLRSGGKTWVRTTDGAYRFDEGIHLEGYLDTTRLLGIEVVLGRVVRIRDIRYITEDGDRAYDESFSGNFEAILAADQETLERQVSAGQYSAAAVLERTVAYGRHNLYLLVRDAHGNTERFEFPSIWILPWTVMVPGIILILLLAIFWLRATFYRMTTQFGKTMENILAGPTLDNYEGYICAIFEDEDHAIPISRADDLPLAHPGQRYRMKIRLQPNPPESGFSESLDIRDGEDAGQISFQIAPDSDTLRFTPPKIVIEVTQGERSPDVSFFFSAPEEVGVHEAWINVSQKGRLVQVVPTKISVVDIERSS